MTVDACTFAGNGTTPGGRAAGFFQSTGVATIGNSTFVKNVAQQNGGAMRLLNPVSCLIADTLITGNSAGAEGGAMDCVGGLITIERSTISQNVALEAGGITASATSSTPSSEWILRDSVVADNFADNGGGGIKVRTDGPTPFTVLIERTSVRSNVAQLGGGGLLATGSTNPNLSFTIRDAAIIANWGAFAGAARTTGAKVLSDRVTIFGNQANQVAGVSAAGGGWTIRNSVLAGNVATGGDSGLPSQIEFTGGASFDASYSLFPSLPNGSTNIAGVPTFVDALGADGTLGTADDDLRPAADSLQLNAGDPSFLTNGLTDLAGEPRIQACRVDLGGVESPFVPRGAPDWNADGITDACDIFLGLDGDCDVDGVPNQAEIAAGQPDCDDNGIPDACELAPSPFAVASPQLTPIGDGFPQSFAVPSPPMPIATVTLTFTARADLGSQNEFITVTLNGVTIGTVFVVGSDCSATPLVGTLTLTPAAFLAATGGGTALIGMVASPAVAPAQCVNGFIAVSLSYLGPPPLDLNNNGVLDVCEAAGDFDGDGVIGPEDLAELLAAWGPCPGCVEDLNHDGQVGASDLATLLGAWK